MKETCTPEQLFELWIWLSQASFAISKSRQKELNKYGLTEVQTIVLLILKSLNHKPTPGEIAYWLFREHNSVSEILNRMEKKGLLIKHKDPSKKNMVRISMTEKGEQAYLLSTKRESILNVFSGLSSNDCKQLLGYIKKLRNRAVKQAGFKNKPIYPPSA
jgi:DNA-binding MarR family transcriptional regulator